MWVPHRALAATTAATPAFDAHQWTPLDGCALHGAPATLRMSADPAACTAIAPGIGAQAALIALAVEHDGEWLHVRLFADQARGADAREDARLVRWFTGWTAINGAGPKADAASRDWHMDRSARIGSEGGALHAQVARRESSGLFAGARAPDLSRRQCAGAEALGDRRWQRQHARVCMGESGSDADRINLGWVQVGLEREGDGPAAKAK